MGMIINEYFAGDHVIDSMLRRKITPEEIRQFVLGAKVKEIPGRDGTTKLILNRTRIKELITNIEKFRPKNDKDGTSFLSKRIDERIKELQNLSNDGGITAIVNKETKMIVTVY
jgi:hypothetical protein